MSGSRNPTADFADTTFDPERKSKAAATEPGTAAGNEAKPNEKLRVDMLTLVAGVKAGKVALLERPQIQPAKSNNLSKGTKIAIGVGIAVAIIAVIVIVKADKGPSGPISVF